MKCKRILSLLLTLCMVLGLLPGMALTASAEEGTHDHSSEGTVRYEPLEISADSLNGNAIWGVTEEWSRDITLDKSAAFYAQLSSRNSGKGGLPVNGSLKTTNGTPYQLATGGDKATAYDGNDCIRLYSDRTSVTMDLQTIGVYQNIYVLATAGGPGEGNYAKFNVTLNYTDGTKSDTTYQLYDWYDLTEVPGVEKYYPVMRKENSGGAYTGEMDTSKGPILQSATIQAEPTKLLESITFNLHGLNDTANIADNLYCGIFAVTGATPAGVPDAPVATAATKTEGDTSCAFTANWKAVDGATSYLLDVATDRKFTKLTSYNNKAVGNVTSCPVSLDVSPDVTYYYRVRAVNDKGQSLSSNRISADLPSWLKNALDSGDYTNVTYDAETNTVTFKRDVPLKDTITLPTDDTTVINLGGRTVTAPAGKPAISAGAGSNVELTVTGDGTSGRLVGNGTTESGDGAPVIDFSKATGSSKVAVGNSAVSGSSGRNAEERGNGGIGGAGIAASNNTQVEVGSGATVTGGNGGSATSGTGGSGGAGISGGNVSVSSGGTVTGGNGGDATGENGTGGSGGAGITASNNSPSNSGTVTGGTTGSTGSTTPTQYSVAYNANDGSGTVPASVTQNRGSSVTVASGSGLWRTGYTFAGWNTVAKPTNENPGTSYAPDSTVSTGATLYAQWKPNTYTVKFNANGGTGTMEDQSLTYDAAAAMALRTNSFTKTGYHFAGWATSAGGSVVYSDKQSVKNLASDGSVTLYAVWV